MMGLRGGAVAEARGALQVLFPVPALTALRCVSQGRLVAGRRTGFIALATALRTVFLAGLAVLLSSSSHGAWIAGAAFSVGLLVETATVGMVNAPAGAKGQACGGAPQTGVLSVSGPLVVNVVLWWATPLVITGVLARTPDADLAIATFVVVEAAGWFFTAPVGQLQNAAIALVDGDPAHRRVRAFAAALALCVTLVLGVLALSPFREQVLWSWFRLDATVMHSSLVAFPLTVGYPFLYAYRQYHQGLFMRVGRTGPVGLGAVIRIVVVLVGGGLLLRPLGGIGARLGIMLALAGLIAEDAYLTLMHRRWVAPSWVGILTPQLGVESPPR